MCDSAVPSSLSGRTTTRGSPPSPRCSCGSSRPLAPFESLVVWVRIVQQRLAAPRLGACSTRARVGSGIRQASGSISDATRRDVALTPSSVVIFKERRLPGLIGARAAALPRSRTSRSCGSTSAGRAFGVNLTCTLSLGRANRKSNRGPRQAGGTDSGVSNLSRLFLSGNQADLSGDNANHGRHASVC